MKKPNITKGKWEECITPQVRALGMPHVVIADCRTDKLAKIDKEEQQLNAKAISAVPDMIDTLVLVYKEYRRMKIEAEHAGGEMWEMDKAILDKIEQALKKAGCV